MEGKILRKNPRKAAVMALFYPDSRNMTHLLCILRKTYEGIHSNQVALPGGKAEREDGSLKITALRETYEEVGVNPKDVEIVRTISEVYIPPSNFEVQPFIGLYKEPKPFKIQESEVASLLEISLTDFLEDINLTSKKLSTSYAKEISVPAFKLNDYIIWGATAMMLSEIKDLLKQVL
ncbi:CoA pyrophosphatase [Maribacter litopenaei]|uniref:NUDIX hydrolase n=1 Tax=Maribacter litopenaei TaxID=2976127 RepID=UPI00308429D7